jgi:hypothetical protein
VERARASASEWLSGAVVDFELPTQLGSTRIRGVVCNLSTDTIARWAPSEMTLDVTIWDWGPQQRAGGPAERLGAADRAELASVPLEALLGHLESPREQAEALGGPETLMDRAEALAEWQQALEELDRRRPEQPSVWATSEYALVDEQMSVWLSVLIRVLAVLLLLVIAVAAATVIVLAAQLAWGVIT